MKFSDVEEVITKEELKLKAQQDEKQKKSLLQKLDLGKRFPNYVNKKLFRSAFIVVAVIQIIAVGLAGWTLTPAWAECNKDVCSNPFFEATGKVCDQNPNLCSVPTLYKGEILGDRPPLFTRMANPLSWFVLITAAALNHRRYKNGKRI